MLFRILLFDEEKVFMWKVTYLIHGNSYSQEYFLDAPDEAKAKEVFDREVPGVQKVLNIECICKI